MPHFRVDDALDGHPKTQRAGDEALGMWVRAGSWCMRYLTDGFVPDWWVKQQPKGAAKARKLVEVGLWHSGAVREGEKGYQFHEFTGPGRQDSREKIEAEREKWRRKKETQRADSPKESKGVSPGDTSGESLGESRFPTQPNPEENSGQLPESATDSKREPGVAATIGAQLLAEAGIDPKLPDAPRLRSVANELVKTGSAPADVVEALQEWNSKTGIGPGILRSLVSDVVKRRNGHSMATASGNGRVAPSKRKVNAALEIANRFAEQPTAQPALEAR